MSLTALLDEGRAGGAFPMAAAAVIDADGTVREGYCGGATPATRWDLASLTKPRAVVTVCMRLVSQGRLALDSPIAGLGDGAVTARMLLGHRAGLAAWRDLVAALPPGFVPGSEEARRAIAVQVHEEARVRDPGRGVAYSDLGFIVLGWHLEALTGEPLERLAPGFPGDVPLATRGVFAPTGFCPARERFLRGEVHDANAWALGGVAGHAGQFGTLGEVGAWAGGLMRLALAGDAGADLEVAPELAGIAPAVVREFWDPAARDPRGTWLLGWDTPSAGASSAGTRASPDAVGHLGFTGTSVWIDRALGKTFVLLSNRAALGPEAQPALRAFRPRFHDLARDLA